MIYLVPAGAFVSSIVFAAAILLDPSTALDWLRMVAFAVGIGAMVASIYDFWARPILVDRMPPAALAILFGAGAVEAYRHVEEGERFHAFFTPPIMVAGAIMTLYSVLRYTGAFRQ